MPATPRNDKIQLRLTTLEKRDWAEAAGGTGKISEWVRSVCNDAALKWRVTHKPSDPEPRSGTLSLIPNPENLVGDPGQPYLVEQDAEKQAHRDTRPLPASPKPRGVSSRRKAPVAVGTPVGATQTPAPSSDCSRWMHHRPGVYCGTCKKVTPK